MSIVQEIVSQPDTSNAAGGVTRVPVSVLNLSWVFTHYPTAWTYEGGEWLPELSRLSFRDGLNGQANGNTNAPKAHATNKGATIIEPSNPKLGAFKNYRHTIPAVDPNSGAVGTYFCAAWEKPTMVGNRNVRWDVDGAALAAFRRLLVTAGLVEPISRVVAEGKIDAMEGTLDHLQALPRNIQRDARMAAMAASIDAMRASLADIKDDFIEADPVGTIAVEPPPQPRTRRLGKPAGGEA